MRCNSVATFVCQKDLHKPVNSLSKHRSTNKMEASLSPLRPLHVSDPAASDSGTVGPKTKRMLMRDLALQSHLLQQSAIVLKYGQPGP